MEIVLTGVNHKTAPVETRERVAIIEAHVPASLQSLISSGTVRECVVLSTCNRTELYCLGRRGGHAAEAVVGLLSSRQGLEREELLPHLYHRFNEDAARHLFTVAAGLDSMILGEGQILSQVRKALGMAQENGATAKIMTRLFETAIRVGKRARSETRISQGAASVSFAAVELARRIYGNLAAHPVLVVGTGKMGLLTARLLITAGARKLTLLSRTKERAEAAVAQFADKVQTAGASMEQMEQELLTNDIVISCTGSPVSVITRRVVAATLRPRKYRPLFIVDIAVPRDVEPEVNELEGVYLYNVDDLCDVVDNRMADRQREIDGVRRIVDEEVDDFNRFFASLEAVPAIRRLRESFEHTRAREVREMLSRMDLRDDERQRLEAFSRVLVNRLLHEPTVRIKDLASSRNVREGVHFLMEIFADRSGAGPRHAEEENVTDALAPAPDTTPSSNPPTAAGGPETLLEESA